MVVFVSSRLVRERRVTAALVLGHDVASALELGVRLPPNRLAEHLTALYFLALGGRAAARRCCLRPGPVPELRNISTPVTMVFCYRASRRSQFLFLADLMTPRSTRPVTTVPRPEIENTSPPAS